MGPVGPHMGTPHMYMGSDGPHMYMGPKSCVSICVLAHQLSNMHMGTPICIWNIVICPWALPVVPSAIPASICIWEVPYAYGTIYWQSSVGNNNSNYPLIHNNDSPPRTITINRTLTCHD